MSYKKEAKIISREREEQFGDDPDSPQQLALIADEIEATIKGTKKAIYKVGELLVQAKKLVGHGKFKKWINERFEDLSYPTAVNCMRVYKCCLGRPSIVNSIGTSILYQIAAPAFPTNLREYIFEHGDELSKIKNEHMKKIVTRFKKGQLNIGSPEIVELFKFNQNMATYKTYEKKVTEGMDKIKKLEDAVLATTNKFEWPIHPEEQQTILSKDQSNEVKEIIANIISAVNTLLPERSDTGIKPTLKLIKGSK